MKRFLSVFLTFALLISSAACSITDTPDENAQVDETSEINEEVSSNDELTLTVWYWGEQEAPGYQAYMEEMVNRYEERNTSITVEAVLQESDTLYSAFRTAEAANAGPDIQYLWGGTQAMEDVWMGNAVPISDYLTDEELAVIPEASLLETNWDGKQWGIPAYQFAYGIAYDKEAMQNAEVDPDKPFETWDEFIDVCEKLKNSGVTPLGMGLKDGWLPAWIGIYLGQQNYDSPNDLISLMSGSESFKDEKHSEWLYKLDELKQGQYINDDILSLDFYQGQQLIESGKAAMTFHTQAYAVSLEKSLGVDKIGFAPAPKYGSGTLADSVAAPSQVYIIPSSAKHKEQAADFLLFLHEEDNVKHLYETANTIMPNNNFDEEWLTSEVDKTVMSWLDTKPNFCWQLYLMPGFETEALIPTVQKMFSEDLSPENASNELEDLLDKVITQNPEIHEAFLNWNVG